LRGQINLPTELTVVVQPRCRCDAAVHDNNVHALSSVTTCTGSTITVQI